MKIMYIECAMGAAGDMLTGALSEVCAADVTQRLGEILPREIEVKKSVSVKCGIAGTHIDVTVNGVSEDEHTHEHEHEHTHVHSHSSLHDIEHIVSGFDLPDKVRKDIMSVYTILAEAEAHVHGTQINQIHFHEVGTMDAVADITGVCMLMNEINPDKVIVSPINVGSGTVRCAHGILPVPAPAAAYILRGVPIYSNDTKGELCTPTGAALLKYFADSFGGMPEMRVSEIGCGMGTRDFETANAVRVFLGEQS